MNGFYNAIFCLEGGNDHGIRGHPVRKKKDIIRKEEEKRVDAPISRAEHEEFRRLMESENGRLKEENDRQNHRLAILEKSVQQISNLAASTEKLAVNMENMLKVQEQQGDRLEALESRDGEKWRSAAGYVLTAVLGIVIGFVFKQIGM